LSQVLKTPIVNDEKYGGVAVIDLENQQSEDEGYIYLHSFQTLINSSFYTNSYISNQGFKTYQNF